MATWPDKTFHCRSCWPVTYILIPQLLNINSLQKCSPNELKTTVFIAVFFCLTAKKKFSRRLYKPRAYKRHFTVYVCHFICSSHLLRTFVSAPMTQNAYWQLSGLDFLDKMVLFHSYNNKLTLHAQVGKQFQHWLPFKLCNATFLRFQGLSLNLLFTAQLVQQCFCSVFSSTCLWTLL